MRYQVYELVWLHLNSYQITGTIFKINMIGDTISSYRVSVKGEIYVVEPNQISKIR